MSTIDQDVVPAMQEIGQAALAIPETLAKETINGIQGIAGEVKSAAMGVLRIAYTPAGIVLKTTKKTAKLGLNTGKIVAKSPLFVARGVGQAIKVVAKPIIVTPIRAVDKWLEKPSRAEPAINSVFDSTEAKVNNVLNWPGKITGLDSGAANDDAEQAQLSA